MGKAGYVAVDWGTSSFRLWLIDRAGGVLGERRSQEGMMAAAKLGFAAVLQSHLDAVGAAMTCLSLSAAWRVPARDGSRPDTSIRRRISQASWSAPCRFRERRVTSGSFQGSRSAIPMRLTSCGAKKPSCSGLWASMLRVMRLSAFPGTHSKWAVVKGGAVERFATFMTGELFSVVSRETILSHAVADAEEAEDIGAFKSAVVAAFHSPALAANLLFQVRSSQLLYRRQCFLGARANIGNPDRTGIGGGARRRSIEGRHHVGCIGQAWVLYQLAFDTLSVQVRSIDAEEAVRRGLSMAAKAIWK